MEPYLTVRVKLVCLALLILILGVIFGSGQVASAHRPLFSNPSAGRQSGAIRIADPSVSHVIYMELTAEVPMGWFVLENDGSLDVDVQLGVPVGPADKGVDPVIVLLGPELPGGADSLSEALSFLPPEAAEGGAVVLPLLDEPRQFEEPVTDTESRILTDTTVTLPAPGPYYGLVVDRSGKGGKIWVGFGQREGFGLRDLPRLPRWIRRVREFHEVPGWPRWVRIGASALVFLSLSVGWLVSLRR